MAASAADSGEVGGIDGGSEAAAAAGGGGNKTKRRGAAKPAAKRRRRSPTSQKATDADSKGGSATSDGNGRSEKASTSKKRRANPRWWSAEEDALLRKAVEEFGERNWKKISGACMAVNDTCLPLHRLTMRAYLRYRTSSGADTRSVPATVEEGTMPRACQGPLD